jgi:16S rRNA U516 pseudouridylate synthase RsuA-like enzyme
MCIYASQEYHVVTTPRASDDAVRVLAAGVEITAPANVAGKVEDVTAVTRPCVVARLTPEQKEWKSNSVNDNNNSISGCGSSTITDIDDDRNVGDDENGLLFVLEEGRNRQIRRMCAAMGLNVDSLHRTSFAGITLDAATENPGAWAALSHEEELLMGARMAPTREELRSPEERAERKAKKMAKKLQKGKFL